MHTCCDLFTVAIIINTKIDWDSTPEWVLTLAEV